MKVFCALGNPGPEYEMTRHNAGFLFLDAWIKQFPELRFQDQKHALIAEQSHHGEKIFWLKPLSFMNRSGIVLRAFLEYFRIPVSELVVIYDDVDLPLGTVRFREQGSAGTHNGMKSIISELKTESIARLRIGIESRGSLVSEKVPLHDFVLGRFREDELSLLDASFQEGQEILKKKLAL